MFGRRWIGLAVAAVLVIVVISSVSGSAQQNAWMQGYMAGRLSAGSDAGAAGLMPYMMPGGAFGPHFGGVAPGLLLGLGFLALGFFLIDRRFRMGRGPGGREAWHKHMREEAERWHRRHEGPWGQGGPWQQPPEGRERRGQRAA